MSSSPKQSPELSLEVHEHESTLSYQIVAIQLKVSEKVRNTFESSGVKNVPIKLIWRGKELDGEDMLADPDGSCLARLALEINEPEHDYLIARIVLPNGETLEQSKQIPPLNEMQSDFTDFVSANSSINPGERIRVPAGRYVLDNSIFVNARATLCLDPGVQFVFAPGCGILCQGALYVKGTEEQIVSFGPLDEELGWAGIALNGPFARTTSIENAYIGNGRGWEIVEKSGQLVPVQVKDPANSGETRGGGLLVTNIAQRNDEAPVKLHNLTIGKCNAKKGGGLAVFGSKVHAELLYLDHNRAKGSGGGLHVENGSFIFGETVEFKENYAEHFGGGAAFVFGASFEGNKPIFEKNKVGHKGKDAFFMRSSGNSSKWKGNFFTFDPIKK